MLSAIVPAFNEAENIEPLIGELMALSDRIPIGEVVYVDDGSTDGTLEVLRSCQALHPRLRVVSHGRRMGQSAAFLTGARVARCPCLVFLDADGQNVPADIGRLLEAMAGAAGADRIAVLGQRVGRADSRLKRLSSRLANRLRAAVLDDATRDTGCSLKMICREDYLALPYFDHMHRFLPALLLRSGVALRFVNVSHRERRRGTSKYGFWNRALVGLVDLVGMAWLMRRRLPADYRAAEVVREGSQ